MSYDFLLCLPAQHVIHGLHGMHGLKVLTRTVVEPEGKVSALHLFKPPQAQSRCVALRAHPAVLKCQVIQAIRYFEHHHRLAVVHRPGFFRSGAGFCPLLQRGSDVFRRYTLNGLQLTGQCNQCLVTALLQ